jgi:hypothetical protein
MEYFDARMIGLTAKNPWPSSTMASQIVPRPGRSVRDLLESEIAGARAHQRYGKQGHQHRGRD